MITPGGYIVPVARGIIVINKPLTDNVIRSLELIPPTLTREEVRISPTVHATVNRIFSAQDAPDDEFMVRRWNRRKGPSGKPDIQFTRVKDAKRLDPPPTEQEEENDFFHYEAPKTLGDVAK